jgi:hypothetical protein
MGVQRALSQTVLSSVLIWSYCAGTLFDGELSDQFLVPWALKEGQYTTDEGCAFLTEAEPADQDGFIALSVGSTLSSSHALNLILAVRGGLLGAYNNGPDALGRDTQTVLQRVDPVISFDWDEDLLSVDGLNSGSFSTQWQGYIVVPGDDSYTFSVVSNGAVSLSINSLVVVDIAASAQGPRERTLHLLAKRFYRLELSFSTRVRESYLQLRWASETYVRDQVVPSEYLFHSHQPLGVSPFQSSIMVLPARSCAVTSYVSGPALTMSTAGLSSTFAIKSRDQYGNVRRALDDVFIVKIAPPSERSLDLSTKFNYAEANHVVSYRQTRAGAQLVDAHLRVGLGLQATYYAGNTEDLVEKQAVWHMNGENIDFSAAAGQRLDQASLAAAGAFSVRWHGFLTLPFVQEYTMVPRLGNQSDRIRMWVDSQLVLDQWTSLRSQVPVVNITAEPYHSLPGNEVSVMLEYRHAQGDAKLALRWATTNFTELTAGSCRGVGLAALAAFPHCRTAAEALGYPAAHTSDVSQIYLPPLPTGCFWDSGASKLVYNSAPMSEDCSSEYPCLCGGYIPGGLESMIAHLKCPSPSPPPFSPLHRLPITPGPSLPACPAILLFSCRHLPHALPSSISSSAVLLSSGTWLKSSVVRP